MNQNESPFENNKNDNTNENREASETESSLNAPDDIKAFSFEWQEESEPIGDEQSEDGQNGYQDSEPFQEAQDREEKSEKERNRSLLISAIISACSLFALILFCLLLSLGIIPAGGQKVVYVSVSSNGPTLPSSNELEADLLDRAMNSVVTVGTSTPTGIGTGTGIVLSSDGYIITNYHVIDNATQINVFFRDETNGKAAELVGFSEIDDLAVLKIQAENLTAALFGVSNDCRLCETVYAIGAPEGMEFGWSVSKGIISSKNREVKIYKDNGTLEKKMFLLQTDTMLNPGNSGGPLINLRGEVIGIVTLRLSDSDGIGFAIPIDGALEIIDAIIEYGNADSVVSKVSSARPLLGITCASVIKDTWYKSVTHADGSTELQKTNEIYALEHPDAVFFAVVDGLYVSSLTDGLDAQNHLQVGDIVSSICGISVSNSSQAGTIINDFNVGDTVTVGFYRDGEYCEADIVLGAQND